MVGKAFRDIESSFTDPPYISSKYRKLINPIEPTVDEKMRRCENRSSVKTLNRLFISAKWMRCRTSMYFMISRMQSSFIFSASWSKKGFVFLEQIQDQFVYQRCWKWTFLIDIPFVNTENACSNDSNCKLPLSDPICWQWNHSSILPIVCSSSCNFGTFSGYKTKKHSSRNLFLFTCVKKPTFSQ